MSNPKKETAIVGPEQVDVVACGQVDDLITQAIEKNLPVETMERLLAMRKELKAEWAKSQFDLAMAKFQGEIPVIKKTEKVMNKPEKGGGLRYSYAPLDEIVRQVGKTISNNGLSYLIEVHVKESSVAVDVRVKHIAGHSEMSSFEVPIDKDSYMSAPQKFASAMTYAKRYAFCNVFGILTGDEDDDSNQVAAATRAAKPALTIEQMIAKMNHAQLIEFADKMSASEKYTEEQKAKFQKLLDKRYYELKGGKKK